VHDEGGLLDQRQPFLDAIGKDSTGGRQQRADARNRVVARRHRSERERLAGRFAQHAEELMSRRPPCRIDRRADENHRAHVLRLMHGEIGHDLATHRVGDEDGANQTVESNPASECVGQACDAAAPTPARWLALPLAGQVRDERLARRRESSGERKHVRTRDSVPVDQHDGRPAPDGHGAYA
jgi:hypothetical protein